MGKEAVTKLILIFLSVLVVPITASHGLNLKTAVQEIYIIENIDEGRILKLSNGALYEVDPDNIDVSSAWLLPFPIRITDSGDPNYPLYLINNNTGTRVKVRLQND